MKHIRITYNEYDEILETCTDIAEDTHNNTVDVKRQFLQENNFPTALDLTAHNITDNLKKYLPYLIYYSEVYVPPEEQEKEFAKFKKYILNILYKSVVFMDDEVIEALKTMTTETWTDLSEEEKYELIASLASYYDEDEEADFMSDIKQYSFLQEDMAKQIFTSEKSPA